MKRVLCAIATTFLVAIGLTASFNASNPVYTSGPQLPHKFGAGFATKHAAAVKANPFGLLAPPSAWATLPGYRWKYNDLNWRTNRDGGIVDSTIVTVSNTDFSSDTTAAFPLERVYFPSDNGVTTAVVDSLFALTFCVGGASSAASIDSVYVGAQVSVDGISWVTLTVTGGPAGTFAADAFVTGKPPIGSAGMIESASSNQACLEFNVLLGAIPKYSMGGSGATAPTDQQWFGWRYIRFICTWSLNDEADVLKAWVGHYTNVPAPGGE